MAEFMNIPQAGLKERCDETARANAAKYSLEVWAERVGNFFRSIP